MPKRARKVKVLAAVLAGCLVGAALVVVIAFDGYEIPTGAMAPTIERGDRLQARSIDGSDVGRGDVVIYSPPGQPVSIGRIVAVAGDELGEDGGFLTIDGERADEPWLPEAETTPSIEPQEVPEGHVFVMGDNRGNSLDSRSFGPVSHDDVLQLVVFRWWPLGDVGGF